MKRAAEFLDGTERTQQAIGRSVQKAVATSAVLMARNIAAQPPVKTGRLKGSITQRVADKEAQVSTNVEYAARVNYGFKRRDILGRQYDQAPNPFFERGARASQRPIHAIFEQELGRPFEITFRGGQA